MKITLVSDNLSENGLFTVLSLYKVLSRRYEVEIVGTVWGESVYPACDMTPFRCKIVRGRWYPAYFSDISRLLKSITGDVIYSVKLRFPSFGISLLKKAISGKPLVAHIDNWEKALFRHMSWREQSKKELLLNPDSYFYTALMERMLRFADDVTVTTKSLRERFGGGEVITLLADTDFFNPANYDGAEAKKKLGLDGCFIIAYCGQMARHTALNDVVRAIELLGWKDARLLVIGGGLDARHRDALKESGGDLLVMTDILPWSEMPNYYALADLIVLPYNETLNVKTFMPLKVFESMAMEKTIIASDVSEYPEVLEGCGLLFEPGNVENLAGKIEWARNHRAAARKMGRRARVRCVEKYSLNAAEEKLARVFGRYE